MAAGACPGKGLHVGLPILLRVCYGLSVIEPGWRGSERERPLQPRSIYVLTLTVGQL